MLIEHFQKLAYPRLIGVVAAVFVGTFGVQFNDAFSAAHLPDSANLGQVKTALTHAAGAAFSQAFGAAMLAAITTLVQPLKRAALPSVQE